MGKPSRYVADVMNETNIMNVINMMRNAQTELDVKYHNPSTVSTNVFTGNEDLSMNNIYQSPEVKKISNKITMIKHQNEDH
jgi:hypothetical protein